MRHPSCAAHHSNAQSPNTILNPTYNVHDARCTQHTPWWIGKMSSLVESKFTLYAVIVKVWSALKFEIEKNHFVPKYVEPKFRFRTWNWTFRETDRALRLEREKEAQGLMTMFTKTIKMSNCEWALNGLPGPHLFLNLLANVYRLIDKPQFNQFYVR